MAGRIDEFYGNGEMAYGRTQAFADMIEVDHHGKEYIRPEADDPVTVKADGREKAVHTPELRDT